VLFRSQMYGTNEGYDDSEMSDDEDDDSDMYGDEPVAGGRSYGDDAENASRPQGFENMGGTFDEADQSSAEKPAADGADQLSPFSFVSGGEPTLAPPEPIAAEEAYGDNRVQDAPSYGVSSYGPADNEADDIYETGDDDEINEAEAYGNEVSGTEMNGSADIATDYFEQPTDKASGTSVEDDETVGDFRGSNASSGLSGEGLLDRAKAWAEDSLTAAGSAIRDLSQRLPPSDTVTSPAAAVEQQPSAGYGDSYLDQPEF
jgi:hypothetical protein